ncbi:MAG: peptidoglycan bridge formation glycyltransferase FemA/FemB family protein [Bacilli bacterium]|nr:peptidoglycan bridge formation glycyltransferase FemA/FemB family protein [Bacilli bacterium]
MEFIENVEKNKYEKFVKNHKLKSHFLQSYAWGEFSKKCKNFTPHYVGLIDEKKNLHATALLLEKKLPLGYSYFYSPRGFVIDFYDKGLLKEFTNKIKSFAKKRKAIFIKIDPDIIWRKENNVGEEIQLEKDPKIVFESLKELGFKHLGFTKNFETMQPRYTFRIDMNKSFEEIENNFSKTTKQRINKGEQLKTKVRLGTLEDVKEFSHLMDLTENRKDFVSHEYDYYKNLFEIYNKDNKMDLFIGSINTEEVINMYKDELKEVEKKLISLQEENLSKSNKTRKNELEKRKEKLLEYIKEYQEARDKYQKEIILNGHVIMEYGDKAWVLYAGNHNILMDSYSNYKVYYEHIKYCYQHGIKMYDQFGTIGDLSKDNPRLGLHEFKKKFGGDYVEFIGEFDLVTKKFMYLIFTKLIPLYRKKIRKKAQKKIKKNNE